MINIDNSGRSNTTKQFGIAALFWTTFLVALGLAYLQRMDSPDILLGGFLSILIGLVIGSAIGKLTKNFSDALFWAVLIGAFGYISVASDPLYLPLHRLAWAAVGAVSGATGGSLLPDRVTINTVASAFAAGLTMFVYWLIAPRRTFDAQLDLVVAPLIGGIVAIIVRLVMWIESKRSMPRYVTATWLMAVVIVGNLFSR